MKPVEGMPMSSPAGSSVHVHPDPAGKSKWDLQRKLKHKLKTKSQSVLVTTASVLIPFLFVLYLSFVKKYKRRNPKCC